MVLKYTTEITLGFKAPNFNLLYVLNDKNASFEELKGSKVTFDVFMCNPYY